MIVDLSDVVYYDVVVDCLPVLDRSTSRFIAGTSTIVLARAVRVLFYTCIAVPGILTIENVLLGLSISGTSNLSVVTATTI